MHTQTKSSLLTITFIFLFSLLSFAQQLDTLIKASMQSTDNAAWTPDGKLLFTASYSGNWQVYIRDFTSNKVARLTNHDGNDENPLCSPDGKRVLFSSERGGNQDLWIMDIDGKNQKRLLALKSTEMHPTWHPNGQEILFNSNKDDTTGLAVYTMKLKTKEIKRLTDPKELSTYAQWSPDGKLIAFVKWISTAGSKRDICIMDGEGRNMRNLTNRPQDLNGWPSWSPDGKKVVFSANREGNFQLYEADLEGNISQLIKSDHDDRRAYWNKDHDKLAFDRTVKGLVTTLYIAQFD